MQQKEINLVADLRDLNLNFPFENGRFNLRSLISYVAPQYDYISSLGASMKEQPFTWYTHPPMG